MLNEEIRQLFEKVTDAYASLAEEAIENATPFIWPEDSEQAQSQEEEFKYHMSRVFTMIEEWNAELDKLLDGKA